MSNCHVGGYNGDKDGYAIPAGTDIFISVSVMLLVITAKDAGVLLLFFIITLSYHIVP